MGNVEQLFCEICRDFSDVKYTITPITEMVKNVSFTYNKKAAKCTGCDSEIFVPEIHDENLEARLAAYHTNVL
ncbi:hypothetical protein JZO70_14550 [Enterococcus sp. 669A]|uniref:Uncharacterized protein n=1 Tax=Candidatus Enterococcus moelleringii TaxID=2815325 RepID=A0ABS3LCN9_9ENTE|nr:hypothetical protein [Enterococcus sp. 669A]MBO1307394.1 hypothetical protein [Enterococcus sp. 669A]